jgi:16S rRNA (cytidine1402-2'-O)-methyltransferase
MQLARACAEAGVPCLPVPGACAAVAALSVAGFPCAEFLFLGFLPRRGSALARKLDEVAAETRTLIFYEVACRDRHVRALGCQVFVGQLEA